MQAGPLQSLFELARAVVWGLAAKPVGKCSLLCLPVPCSVQGWQQELGVVTGVEVASLGWR